VFRLRTSPDDKNPKNIIASRVREARTGFDPRLTQADLSALLLNEGIHIDRAGISKIETGERVVLDFELKAIAAVLTVRVGWLIDEAE
jgi:transcriptional regulator with XRE-family HTH domain